MSITASCPAMVGNVAVGLDVLGHCIQGPRDRVRVEHRKCRGIKLHAVTGDCSDDVPLSAASNTATVALQSLLEERSLGHGLEIWLHKEIPVAAGLGGSAASAVAAVIAADRLLGLRLSPHELADYAMAGERSVSGCNNWDNVWPALIGGLVLCVPGDPPTPVAVRVSATWRCVVTHPKLKILTSASRGVLPGHLTLDQALAHGSGLAGFLLACENERPDLLRSCFRDRIAEPVRAGRVRGFSDVRDAALQAGALGASLSGSGPSVFAWCESESSANTVRQDMAAAWNALGISSRSWISPIDAPGAMVETD